MVSAIGHPGSPAPDIGAVAALISGAQHAHISAATAPARATSINNSASASEAQASPAYPHATASSAAQSAAGALLVLDELQRTVAEGPAPDAVRAGQQVLVQDLHTDPRWPQLTTRAPWQVRSILCTPLTVEGKRACLTVFSTRGWAFDDASVRQARAVAAYLDLALTHAQQVRDLTAMAHSRDVIGQAKGILMRQHNFTAPQAFDLLSETSQRTNTTVRTVSEHLTRTGELSPQVHIGR